MKKKPIRILHVVSTMDYGGVETLLMSIYREIDKDKIQFDFLCHNRIECKFKNEIEALGGNLFMIPSPKHIGFIKYGKLLRHFFKEHPEYKIVHCHLNSRNGEIIWNLKKAGVPHRISHSHIAYLKYKFPFSLYFKISRFLNNRYATCRLACSEAAAEFLFDNKMEHFIIPNSISPNRFIFSIQGRTRIRNILGINDDIFLFGHIGRFDPQKNHYLLLKIFSECLAYGLPCQLIIIGAGEQEEQIINWVNEFDIKDNVIFAGQHAELADYYSAMDLFLFPSKYEGLGIVAVEAQCSGLPVVASTGVPLEAKVTDRFYFVPLDAPLEQWRQVISTALINCKDNRESYQRVIEDSMYNLSKTTDYLQRLYSKLSN